MPCWWMASPPDPARFPICDRTHGDVHEDSSVTISAEDVFGGHAPSTLPRLYCTGSGTRPTETDGSPATPPLVLRQLWGRKTKRKKGGCRQMSPVPQGTPSEKKKKFVTSGLLRAIRDTRSDTGRAAALRMTYCFARASVASCPRPRGSHVHVHARRLRCRGPGWSLAELSDVSLTQGVGNDVCDNETSLRSRPNVIKQHPTPCGSSWVRLCQLL